jgi:hypothetical protein
MADTIFCLLQTTPSEHASRAFRRYLLEYLEKKKYKALEDWKMAQAMRENTQQQQAGTSTGSSIQWTKPALERMKCNIDASFSSYLNKVGIGLCIRVLNGCFVLT